MQDKMQVLGIILAGGASRRFGSDKAAALLGSAPLLRHVVNRVRPQVDLLAISGSGRANFDLPVIADSLKGEGPLGGLISGLAWAKEREIPLVVTFACDTPFLPHDLVSTLQRALTEDRQCAVAISDGRMQPISALWRTSVYNELSEAFDKGVRRLRDVVESVRTATATFTDSGDGVPLPPFFNINRQEDLQLAQEWFLNRKDR